MTKRLALILCALLTAGCGAIDRGDCVAGHTRPGWVQVTPVRMGNTTIVQTFSHPATFVCDEWEFPDGRPGRAR